MKDSIKDLLKRYAEGNISEKEREKLFRELEANEHDVKAALSEDLKGFIESRPASSNEVVRYRTKGRDDLKNIIPHYLTRPLSDPEPNNIRRYLLAAVTIGILILGAVYWFQIDTTDLRTESVAKVESFTISGPEQVSLPDGTRVILNTGSELSYNSKFGAKTREVTLKGEGFFEVEHDPTRPFTVKSGKIYTTVLGTAFNVRAFPGEEMKVTVTRGLVQVASATKIYGQIKPNEQITVNESTDNFITESVKPEKAVAWKEQFFILKKVTMPQAAQMIEQRFHVQVQFTGNELERCQVSGRFFKNEGLIQILDILTQITKSTYTVDGNKVIIEGGSCE